MGDSGVILLVYKISTASCEALKHAPVVQPFRDYVSVLRSLVSCIMPRTLSFIVTIILVCYVTCAMQCEWPTNISACVTQIV